MICPNCDHDLRQPAARYGICPGCHRWYDAGAGWTTDTGMPERGYEYDSPRAALKYYLAVCDKVGSPGIESVQFTETATEWDAYGNVVAWERVQTPRVDGGVGSIREERLCALHDLHACLPEDEEQRRALLAGGLWSRRDAAKNLGETEHWVRTRGAAGMRTWRQRLVAAGIVRG